MRIQFLNFTIDADRRELILGDQPVRISPKNFEVLLYLVENRDRMVPKSELMEQFWPANTSDAALQKSISQLRRNLTVEGTSTEVIKTYHGRGFRFVAISEPQESRKPKELQRHLGETRSVTLLCALMPNTPIEENATPAQAIEQAKALVSDHGGQLLQPLIDGFIASFGTGPIFEDTARLAAHCACALAESEDMPWRIGLDSGVLALEDKPRNESWQLPGNLEREAARLAQRAAPKEILLSQPVLDQFQDEFETEATGAQHRLLSVGPLRTGIPGRPRKRLSRYVGREPDLTFLQTQLALATQGQGQAVALSGPPGIGKTRMVGEFLARLDPQNHQSELVQCLPGLRNTPLAPLGALCRRISTAPPDAIASDEIDAALWRLLQDHPNKSDAGLLADLSDRRRQERMLGVLLRLLDEVTQGKTLVLIFEDIHWLDPASHALVSLMLREAEHRAWMIVMTTRPVGTPPPTERTLQLAPLTKAESARLLEDAAGGVDLTKSQLQALVERADGNPFFIEELALTAATGGDPVTDVPSTVHAVIAARIGHLDLGMRQLLFVIAVLGTPADPSRVAILMKRTEGEVTATAELLIRMGFLLRDPRGFVFNHMLIDDTAYAMVAAEDRRALHAEIAALMESSETPERPERLAWHHQEAGHIAQAISQWTAASRDAIHRTAWTEAATFAENGLELLTPETENGDALELKLLLCKAPALIALRGFPAPEVGAAYDRASTLNKSVGNAKTEIRVRVGQWINTWVRGDLSASLGHAEALVALSQKIPDPALILQGHASRGQVLMHLGQLPDALAQLKLGLAAIEGEPPATPQAQNAAVSCSAYASWVAAMMGDEAEAQRLLKTCRALKDLRDNPYATAIHHALCLETYMFLGDVETCLIYCDEAIRVSSENDYAFWLGTGLVMRGWCQAQQGAPEAGSETTREGIEVFANTGAGVQLSNWHGLHAEILLKSGDSAAALKTANQALACAGAVGDVYFTPRIYSTKAQALTHLGRTSEAKAEHNTAQTRASEFQMCKKAFSL